MSFSLIEIWFTSYCFLSYSVYFSVLYHAFVAYVVNVCGLLNVHSTIVCAIVAIAWWCTCGLIIHVLICKSCIINNSGIFDLSWIIIIITTTIFFVAEPLREFTRFMRWIQKAAYCVKLLHNCVKSIHFIVCRCVVWLQWNDICIWSNSKWKNTHHGGLSLKSQVTK